LLLCEDFDLDSLSNRVFNATNRLRRLRTPNYACFSQQIFLADVCGQQSRKALGLDEVEVGDARPSSRQLAFFASREGGYSDGTFSNVVIDLLRAERAWISPNPLFRKLIQVLETAYVEPYVVSAYDERERIEGLRFGSSAEEEIYIQVLPREVCDETEILIGRRAELSVFERSLASLTSASDLEAPRVLLIQGEGGMGKSTLLRQFARECQKFEKALYWMYTDWEVSGITTNGGTPLMMSYLASQLRSGYGLQFPEFEKAHRELKRLDKCDAAGDTAGSTNGDAARTDVERRQLVLSRALMADLAAAARTKPIVLLFDTFEVVQGFADSWVRLGLLKAFLIEPKLRNRIVLVIAGRFGDDDQLTYKDDAKKYFGTEGAFFAKNLDRLSPGEIEEYSRAKFNRAISPKSARHVFRSTSGFPLGVAALLNDVHEGRLNDNDIESLGTGGSISHVTAELAKRFLKHVTSDRDERRRIISFITLRAAEGGQIFDRIHLLKLLWERLQLARDAAHFDSELQALRQKYSFLLSNGLIHPEVWRFLQQWALSSEFEPALTLDVCQEAYRICDTEQDSRTRKLKEWHGEEYYESRKYRDSAWQNWTLDKAHYGLWLNKADDTVDSILDHYVQTLIYGFAPFADSLTALYGTSSVFSVRLDAHHRKLLSELHSLKVGLADDQMNSTRRQLRQSLKGKTKLAMHLQLARKLARRGDYQKSSAEVVEAEEMATKLGGVNDPSLRREFGRTLLLLGERLSASTGSKSAQFRAKDILQRALIWIDFDPHLHCTLADVYLKVDWLDDARFHYASASGEAAARAKVGLERVRARTAIVGGHPVAAAKLARVYTAQASVLCAEGKFDDAMGRVRRAIELVPDYLPAKIRRCHMLRILGDIPQARRELNSIDLNNVAPIQWKASLLDAHGATYRALDQWAEAEDVYRKALELSPDYMNALYGLGLVYLSLGKHAEAIRRFKDVIDVKRRIMSKKNAETATLYWVYIGLGLAHGVAGDSMDADNAFMIAEKLCDRDLQSRGGSRHYQLWTNKALSLLGQRQYGKAAEAISLLTTIPSVSRAKGMYRQFALDVGLLGTVDRSDEFKRVAGSIELLQ
jgi:tetratricopeptide (TPR) repeat protein